MNSADALLASDAYTNPDYVGLASLGKFDNGNPITWAFFADGFVAWAVCTETDY